MVVSHNRAGRVRRSVDTRIARLFGAAVTAQAAALTLLCVVVVASGVGVGPPGSASQVWDVSVLEWLGAVTAAAAVARLVGVLAEWVVNEW